jgi:hypothetical protein
MKWKPTTNGYFAERTRNVVSNIALAIQGYNVDYREGCCDMDRAFEINEFIQDEFLNKNIADIPVDYVYLSNKELNALKDKYASKK